MAVTAVLPTNSTPGIREAAGVVVGQAVSNAIEDGVGVTVGSSVGVETPTRDGVAGGVGAKDVDDAAQPATRTTTPSTAIRVRSFAARMSFLRARVVDV